MKVRRSYAVAGLAIIGFALTLSYAFFQLMSIQRELASYTGENMLWSVTQAEREARKLADHMLLPEPLRDNDASLLQLDILISRLNLLKDNPQYDYLTGLDGAAQPLDSLIGGLSGLDRRRVIDPDFGLELYGKISSSFDELVRLSNKVMLAQREEGGEQRDHHLRTLYLVMISISGILAAGGFMAWQLIANLRALDKANIALNEHAHHLEEMVDERTAALRISLENERFTNAIYKNFLTTVSHQFRTPITIIDMIAQRFIRRSAAITPEILAERSSRIRHAVQRLTRIIDSTISNDILNEQGLPLKGEIFDLRQLVDNVCADHRELHPERPVEVKLPDKVLPFKGDAVLIEQILTNFISNAEKYSPAGLPINVDLRWTGDFYTCAVIDRGIGIPAAERARIFDRFYRASNVAHLSGTGLGLTLSQTLAHLHGGDIHCDFIEPTGTRFILKLPGSGLHHAEQPQDGKDSLHRG